MASVHHLIYLSLSVVLCLNVLVVYWQQMCHKLRRYWATNPATPLCVLPAFVFPPRSQINPATKFSGKIFGGGFWLLEKGKLEQTTDVRVSGLLSSSFLPKWQLASAAFLNKLPTADQALLRTLHGVRGKDLSMDTCNTTKLQHSRLHNRCNFRQFFKSQMDSLNWQQYDGHLIELVID